MPMPTPKKAEEKEKFIERFMSSNAMVSEFPDVKQRLAVAQSEWAKHLGMHHNEEESLYRLISNLSGSVRQDTLDGEAYMVAPVIMLYENALNGAFYPLSEITASVPAWNMKPVTIGHPQWNGKYISAANKVVIESQTVGFLMNAKVEDEKLKAEAWLRESKLRKISPKLMDNLLSEVVTELSTGLYASSVPDKGTTKTGLAYDRLLYDYRPDHLAILLDTKGAMSVQQGAGIPRINQQEHNDMKKEEMVQELVGNKLYAWDENDRAYLQGLNETQLAKMTINKDAIPERVVERPVEKVVEKIVEKTPVVNSMEDLMSFAPEHLKPIVNQAMDLLKSQIAEHVAFIQNKAKDVWTLDELNSMQFNVLMKIKKSLETASPVLEQPVPAAGVTNYAVNALGLPSVQTNAKVTPLPDPWATQPKQNK